MRYLTSALWSGSRLLLDDAPDWAQEINTRHQAPVEIEPGLTANERRATRSAGRVRTSQAWSVVVRGLEVSATRDALQRYQNEPLLIPVWPLIAPAGQQPAGLSVGLWLLIAVNGATSVTSVTPTLGSAAAVVPLLVGRWRESPRVDLINPVLAVYALDAEDNGEGLTWSGYVPAPGPTDGRGSVRPILPAWPNFAEGQQSGTAPLPVEWAEHRASLTNQSAYYAQPAGRDYAFSFTFPTQAIAADWLRFWAAQGGSLETLWLPSFAAEGAGLLADAPAGATVIQCDLTGAGDVLNRGLALFSAPTLEVIRIASVVGNTVTLATPLANSWGAQDTLVGLAALARFAGPELQLAWNSSTVAGARCAFVETPLEYATQAGETTTTQGSVGAVFHLYTFERWTDAGLAESRRFTDAATSQLIAGLTYNPAPYTHGDISQSLNLEADSLSLKVRTFAGDPLGELAAAAQTDDALWRIEVAEVVGSATPRVLFYGEVTALNADGPWFEASAIRFGGLPERSFPSALVQTGCNYSLFSRACGLAKAAWASAATVASSSGSTMTVTASLPSGAGGPFFNGWFAGGTLNAGGTTARILTDTGGGSTRVLTLDRALGLVTGATVTLLPGCDGEHTTCRAYDALTNPLGKFNNYANHGGFPWLPIANPLTGAVRNPAPSTGKK